MQEISDPLSWSACFLVFMAAKVDHQEPRDLAAYGILILQLALKHSGSGWLVYDCQYRQHQAAGANLPWSDVSPSLMAATVLSQASGDQGRSCSLCLAADHSREDCALAALELNASSGHHTTSCTYYPDHQYRRPAQ